jgi:hypothetical protein
MTDMCTTVRRGRNALTHKELRVLLATIVDGS